MNIQMLKEVIECVCRHRVDHKSIKYCSHPMEVACGRYLVKHCKADSDCPEITAGKSRAQACVVIAAAEN